MPVPHVSAVWLVVPLAVACCADVALTLRGQPAAYHAGDTAAAVEANPLARPLLMRGPEYFLAFAAGWLAGFALLAFVPAPWAARCMRVATLGHAVGGAAWLVRTEPVGGLLGVGYLVGAVLLARMCWARGANGRQVARRGTR